MRSARLLGSATDTLWSRLGAAILASLRVVLARLHMRFEHASGGAGSGFSCGLTLDRFELGSPDGSADRGPSPPDEGVD